MQTYFLIILLNNKLNIFLLGSTVGKLILNITVNNCILKRRKLDNNGASFLGNKYVDEYLGRYSKLSNLD